MSVVIETTLGEITIDLYIKERPKACLNFLKLCKIKYFNYNLFHTVNSGFVAQTGDPTGSRNGGESIFGVLEGPLKRYFEPETQPRIKHTEMGLISFVGDENNMIGSQFFVTLAPDLTYLDDKHCVFGEVVEGFEVLDSFNEAICDTDYRPYQDIRITHTVILDDPFPDPKKLIIPERSPSPSAERLQGGRIAPDEDINEFDGKSFQEIAEMKAEREAKARATILEMVGDIPDAEMAPPENVLFVCKLNPVTTDDDLEIIFSRFGKINSCEVIRDRKTGDSLQYAFIEFAETKSCEDAYFKMDNVLIDDRRIHVDFSQSVAKVKWLGKGRGVAHYDDQGKQTTDTRNDTGKGNYKKLENSNNKKTSKEKDRRDTSPKRNSRRSPTPQKRRSRSRDKDRYRMEERKGNGYHERDRGRYRNNEYTRNVGHSSYYHRRGNDFRERREERKGRSERDEERKGRSERDEERKRRYEKDKRRNDRDEEREGRNERDEERKRRYEKDEERKGRNERDEERRYKTKDESTKDERNKDSYEKNRKNSVDRKKKREKSTSSSEDDSDNNKRTKQTTNKRKHKEQSSDSESDEENNKKKSSKQRKTESSTESDSEDEIKKKKSKKSKKKSTKYSSDSDSKNKKRKKKKSKNKDKKLVNSDCSSSS